ncbi:MAG: hypothetical protein QM811_00990 [Pirellulales bacterium]
MGYYLSSHPLAEHVPVLETYCTHKTSSIANLKHRDEVMLGGMMAALKFSQTKNPRRARRTPST